MLEQGHRCQSCHILHLQRRLLTVLLVFILISSVTAVISKKPDTHYHPMPDGRDSFTMSQVQSTMELDTLKTRARGESKHDCGWIQARVEDNNGRLECSSHSKKMRRPAGTIPRSNNTPSPQSSALRLDADMDRHVPPCNQSWRGFMKNFSFQSQRVCPSPCQRDAEYK